MNIISALQSTIAHNKYFINVLQIEVYQRKQDMVCCDLKYGHTVEMHRNFKRFQSQLKKLVERQKALKKQLALHIYFTTHGKHIPYERYLEIGI